MDEDYRKGLRLLAHLKATETRWFKVSAALLNWGRHKVPETRDSYNPVKYLASWLGAWMDQRQTNWINRKFDKENP